MPEPYIGEIRMFGGNFPPAGWAFCDGSILPISENDTLFTLIGTTYGGDGQETFALPDLRGRLPMHQGTGRDGITYTLAESAGVEAVTLTTQQIPIHNHALLGSTTPGAQSTPIGNMLAANNTISIYKASAPNVALNAQAATATGGSQPHSNMQPYLGINFIISLFGVFPSQT
jgi:microcystin-dependent protein